MAGSKKPEPRSKVLRSKPSSLAKSVFGAHISELGRFVEKNGVGGVELMYQKARAELVDRLKSYRSDDLRVEPLTLRTMLGQVEGVLSSAGSQFGSLLKDSASTAVDLGAHHAVEEFRILQARFRGTVPIVRLEVPAVFEGLVKEVDSSLLRRHLSQSRSWTATAITNVEQKLSTSAMIGKPTETVIDDVQVALDTERWRAERIVRTEMAYGHGAAKQGAIEETSRELEQPLWKRLIETFSNGRALDDRVGDDSFLLHGQMVPATSPFTWKKKVKGRWVLEQFMHPPNRPNDRAVVIPWDPEWEDTELERPLSIAELRSAPPTRWRSRSGVDVPSGHKPGRSYLARKHGLT